VTGIDVEGEPSSPLELNATELEVERMEEGDDDDSDNGEMAAGTSDITIGGQRRKLKRVKKVGVHKVMMEDLYQHGEAMLVNMNLPAVRLRRKARESRERMALHDMLYDFVKNLGGNFPQVLRRARTAKETSMPPCWHEL
jgi:hypothetical protein